MSLRLRDKLDVYSPGLPLNRLDQEGGNLGTMSFQGFPKIVHVIILDRMASTWTSWADSLKEGAKTFPAIRVGTHTEACQPSYTTSGRGIYLMTPNVLP